MASLSLSLSLSDLNSHAEESQHPRKDRRAACTESGHGMEEGNEKGKKDCRKQTWARQKKEKKQEKERKEQNRQCSCLEAKEEVLKGGEHKHKHKHKPIQKRERKSKKEGTRKQG